MQAHERFLQIEMKRRFAEGTMRAQLEQPQAHAPSLGRTLLTAIVHRLSQ